MHNQLEVVPNNKLALPDKWVSAEIALAKSYYPSTELTKAQIQVYALEIADIAREVGTERAHGAVVSACRTCNFFPSIAQIRDAAGLNPAKLLAVAQDRAWRLARKWREKWGRGVTANPAGYRADVRDTYEADCYWTGHKLPARIRYAVEQAGGWAALDMDDPKDLSFTRQAFNSGFERFAQSEFSAPDLLDPFAGKTDDELLARKLVDRSGIDVPDGTELLSMTEHGDRERQRIKQEHEEYLRTRTPEQKDADDKRDAILRGIFPTAWKGLSIDEHDPDAIPTLIQADKTRAVTADV